MLAKQNWSFFWNKTTRWQNWALFL